jgi:hypothetical protein
MAIREQMLAILETAEAGLARLAAEAVAQRAYVDAALLLEAARQIGQIGQDTFSESGDRRPSATDAKATPRPAPAPQSQTSSPPARGRKPKKSDYPKFFRDGDTLIKVGWSKSEGSEYEHKCPKRVLDVLVAELTRIAGPGRRFVMDKVLPLRDPETGTEFSTYQPYLALAFLRQSGLIEQHGRSGYSIPKTKSFVGDAGAAWQDVAPR